jgi:hypothetical protein
MKKIVLYFLFLFYALTINAQTVKKDVGNHVFIMCDNQTEPVTVKGQAFYIVLHDNGVVQMLCGSTLKDAISYGPTKSGSWTVTGNAVNWEWTDGKSASWRYSSSTHNLISGESILKNMGAF